MENDIVAIGAARTPLGTFGGSFRDTPVWDLGAAVIRATLERAGVPADAVDQVILGNCRQAGNGPNPARTAAVKGGIPISVPAYTVNMACPSGMKSVMLAAQELASGHARIVLAGGMESMSTMPYLLKNVRWEGFKLGDKTLSDSWSDTVDPLCGFGMGMTAENQVQKYGISRAAQDEFAGVLACQGNQGATRADYSMPRSSRCSCRRRAAIPMAWRWHRTKAFGRTPMSSAWASSSPCSSGTAA